MQVSLIRRSSFAEAGVLDPETGRIEIDRPAWGREPAWLPEVPAHGFFDTLGGLLVAVYRSPRAAETLWLQLGSRRFAFTHRLTSHFSPDLPPGDPSLGDPAVLRSFTLLIGGRPVARHRYRLNPGEHLLDAETEPLHDLLFFAHRVMADRAWARVLAGGRRAS